MDTPQDLPNRNTPPKNAPTKGGPGQSLPSMPGVPLVESPFFEKEIEAKEFSNHDRRVAFDLYEKGYAVLDFPDDDFHDRADHIIDTLKPSFDIEGWRASGHKNNQGLRLQDGWRDHENIKTIASNQTILSLLTRLYGREAFPFQTLNFPVGTQQQPHSDAVHFSSVPERFMVGVWVAMEDVGPDQGPLVYYPGSHKWPLLYNQMFDNGFNKDADAVSVPRYRQYLNFWQSMVKEQGIEPEYFHAKKGQALIWSSNILHGGSPHKDPNKTRWSQVTHYYFKNCVYFVPSLSDPIIGRLRLKTPVDVATGKTIKNTYIDTPLSDISG